MGAVACLSSCEVAFDSVAARINRTVNVERIEP